MTAHSLSSFPVPRPSSALLLTAIAAAIAAGAASAQAVRFAPLAPPPALPPRADMSQALVAADFDGDGDVDVVFANRGQNTLHRNLGGGRFEDITATHMPPDTAWSTQVCAGDVDGDGDLDLFVANRNAANQLLLNDGSGGFSDVTPPAVAAHQEDSTAALMGDVDGDGDLDLVVGNYAYYITYSGLADGQNRLYLNDGSGQFTETTNTHMPTGSGITQSMLMLDLDGDGDVDLVELGGQVIAGTSYSTFTVSSNSLVHLNDGAGVFSTAFGRMPVAQCLSATAFDPDLDGDPDLLLVNGWGQPLLYRNDGFGYLQDVSAGAMPFAAGVGFATSVVAPDLDGDGDPDVLIGTLDGEELAFENLGNGTFWWMADHPTHGRPSRTRSLASADVDGDGDLDLLFASDTGPNLLLGWNPPDGFVDPDAAGGGLWVAKDYIRTRDAVLVDLDGDGRRDLLLVDGTDTVQVQRHSGFGYTRTPDWAPTMSLADAYCLAVADLDGDGSPDAVFGASGALVVCINDGTGRLVHVATIPNGSAAPARLRLADLNGDGALDAVLTSYSVTMVQLGDGAGGFAAPSALPFSSASGTDMALLDIDADGDVDIVVCTFAGAKVYANDGSGGFSQVVNALSPNLVSPGAVDAADVDGDGDMDLVFEDDITATGQAQVLYLNNGAGSFVRAPVGQLPAHGLAAGQRLERVQFIDFDGDGDADLVSLYHVVSSNGWLPAGGARLFANQGTGTYVDVSALIAPPVTQPAAILGDDVDLDGDLDLVVVGTPRTAVYFNLVSQLDVPQPVRPGGALELQAYVRVGAVSPVAVMLPWVAMAPASVTLPPFGHLGIDPLHAVALPSIPIAPATGTGSSSIPIPNQPGLIGVEIYTQGFLLNPPYAPGLTNTSRRILID